MGLLHVTPKFETKIFSVGNICPGEPHQRSTNAPKFEDRSLEETEWQEQSAREAAWNVAQKCVKIQGAWKSNILKPEETEFVADSGASIHMISKKDLSDAEMDTLTESRSPTIVITAKGEVQTHEEAIVYVKDLDIFLTMKVLDNTPEVIVAWKALRWKRVFLRMDQWSKTTSH